MAMLMKLPLMLTCLITALCVFTSAQQASERKSLVVNGHSGEATFGRMNGRACVDLEDLVKVANGSLQVRADLISLALPEASATSSQVINNSDANPNPAMSREFVKAGIEATAEMREWATALAYIIENGYGLTETWVIDQRERTGKALKLAKAAASSAAETDAVQLLSNEFNAVREWSETLLTASKSMDTAKYAISEGALRNEPLSQKIITCGHFLDRMLAQGEYQDDVSCH